MFVDAINHKVYGWCISSSLLTREISRSSQLLRSPGVRSSEFNFRCRLGMNLELTSWHTMASVLQRSNGVVSFAV